MVDIRYGWLLPTPFHELAIGLIPLGFLLIFFNVWIGLLILLTGTFLSTLYEGTEINTHAKTYREYTSILFIKTGTFNPYSTIEKIFINSGKESQTLYTAHTNHSRQEAYAVYNAYLKFSNGEKIKLLKHKDKSALLIKLKSLCDQLAVRLEDYSQR